MSLESKSCTLSQLRQLTERSRFDVQLAHDAALSLKVEFKLLARFKREMEEALKELEKWVK